MLKVAARLALPALIMAVAMPVFAVDVTFSTSGEFCNPGPCTSGPNSVVFGTGATAVTLAYTGLGPTSLVLGPEVDLGFLTLTTTATNAKFDGTIPAGESFALVVTQTNPPPTQSGAFQATLQGTLAFNQNTATITFSNDTITLGGVNYALFQDSQPLGDPSVGSIGQTNIEGSVTPEPTFMLLTGLGFGCLAFLAYRRKRNSVIL